MTFNEAEIKELWSAVGEVRRILRDQAKNGCDYSKNRLEIVNQIIRKIENNE